MSAQVFQSAKKNHILTAFLLGSLTYWKSPQTKLNWVGNPSPLYLLGQVNYHQAEWYTSTGRTQLNMCSSISI